MNRIPRRELSADEIASFRTDGVVHLPGMLDAGWLELLDRAIERDIAGPAPGFHGYEVSGGGKFHGNFDIWRSDEELARYCLESPLPVLAAQLLDVERVQLFYDQLFVKEPGTDSPTPWHNDQPYWPLSGRQVLSIWVTLDQVTLESGALEFIRGSHRWNRWFQPKTFSKGGFDYDQNPDYEPIPDFEAERDSHDILTWDLDPGDLLAFHALTVHGSGGNLATDRRRRGYTVRFAGPDATYDPRPGTNAALHQATHPNGAALEPPIYPIAFSSPS